MESVAPHLLSPYARFCSMTSTSMQTLTQKCLYHVCGAIRHIRFQSDGLRLEVRRPLTHYIISPVTTYIISPLILGNASRKYQYWLSTDMTSENLPYNVSVVTQQQVERKDLIYKVINTFVWFTHKRLVHHILSNTIP